MRGRRVEYELIRTGDNTRARFSFLFVLQRVKKDVKVGDFELAKSEIHEGLACEANGGDGRG